MKTRIGQLKPRDGFTFTHSSGLKVVAVVARTYESGGKKGAAYTGVMADGTQIQGHLKEGMPSVEVLWREAESPASETQE